jgi:RNA polymerase-binding transcription factor DksA
MDIADQAQEVEELHREQALRKALQRPVRSAPVLVTECVDCSDPIPPERLQVYPIAMR